jgi:muramidase (phage lysozyme)
MPEEKYDAVFVAGHDNTKNPNYLTPDEQLAKFKKGFGTNKKVKGYAYTTTAQEVLGFLASNPRIPVFLFSAGCDLAAQGLAASRLVDSKLLFLIEPWAKDDSKKKFQLLIESRVVFTQNIFVGPDAGRGLGIDSGNTKTTSGSHFDSLTEIGKKFSHLSASSATVVPSATQTGRQSPNTSNPNPQQPLSQTIIVGDFIAELIQSEWQKDFTKLPQLTSGDITTTIDSLINRLKKVDINNNIKKLVLSIGSSDGWRSSMASGVDNRDSLITQLRRIAPNAELYILTGSWGWVIDTPNVKSDLRTHASCDDACWGRRIDAFTMYFTDKKFSRIGIKNKLDKQPAKNDVLFNSFRDDFLKYKIIAGTQTTQSVPGVDQQPANGNVPVAQPESKGDLNTSGKEKSQQPQRNEISGNGIVNLFPATVAPPAIVIPVPKEDGTKSEFVNTFGYLPFIWYNAYQIDIENVDYFSITYEGILPVVKFSFRDTLGISRDVGTPLDNSKITIFLNSRSESLRPFHMQFKITSFNNYNSIMSIIGVIDVDALFYQSYKSYIDSTSNKALQDLAKEIGLGFNTNVVETSDRMNWMNTGLKNHEFITEILNHAYISDESFIAGNLDLFYNLNFIDVQKELARKIDDELGILKDGLPEALKEAPQTLTPPLFLTSDESMRGTSYFFSSWKLINRATNTALNQGYYDDFIFLDTSSKKVHNFDLHSMNLNADSSIVMKGNSEKDDFFKSNKNYVYGGKVVADNSHINYSFADTHNKRNILEAEKMAAVIELPFPNFLLYRFQKIRIILSHNSSTLANPGINTRYSGDWLIVDIKFLFFDRSFRQVVTMVKRELGLSNEEAQAGIGVKQRPQGRGQNVNPVLGVGNAGTPEAAAALAAAQAGSSASQARRTETPSSAPLIISQTLTVAIGDSIAVALASVYPKSIERGDNLAVVGWDSANLLKVLKSSPVFSGVTKCILSIGSNEGWIVDNTTKEEIVKQIRRVYPNGKMYILNGNWGWGNLAEGACNADCWKEKIKSYLQYYTNNGFTTIGTAIKVTKHPGKGDALFNSYDIDLKKYNLVNNKDANSGQSPTMNSKLNQRAAAVPNSTKIASFGKVSETVPIEGRAILDMIAYFEGTAGVSQNGYDILFAFRKIEGWTPNYTKPHPDIKVTSGSITSTAAGRYQFLSKVWKEYAGNKPFNKSNQDDAGWLLVVRKRGIPQVQMKNSFDIAKSQIRNGQINIQNNKPFLKFLDTASYEWASLPSSSGSHRYKGQGKDSPVDVYAVYIEAVKKY